MGKYYDESRTKLELELDRANAENTEHYIRMLENRIHEYLAVREELLTFRDSVADAVQANGLCNQGILDKVKELCTESESDPDFEVVAIDEQKLMEENGE